MRTKRRSCSHSVARKVQMSSSAARHAGQSGCAGTTKYLIYRPARFTLLSSMVRLRSSTISTEVPAPSSISGPRVNKTVAKPRAPPAAAPMAAPSVPDSNWLFRITDPAHRRLCLQGLWILEPMERIERSSVAYHATALPLSYIGWSQRGYSKPRPPRYECGALPLELLRRKKNGASAENRTPLIGQAIRCPTNRPHPQKSWSGRR